MNWQQLPRSERLKYDSYVCDVWPVGGGARYTVITREATRRDDGKGNWTTCDIGPATNYGGSVIARTIGPTSKDWNNALRIAICVNACEELGGDPVLRITKLVAAEKERDALRAENARLREALEKLVMAEEDYGDDQNAAINEAWAPARILLEELKTK